MRNVKFGTDLAAPELRAELTAELRAELTRSRISRLLQFGVKKIVPVLQT
jgi:hypothetical protein